MKVLYLTNLPAPYRMRFFQELGKLCNLTVIFETGKATDRHEKWFAESGGETFEHTIMPGIRWDNDSAFNPAVIRWLNKNLYDIIVVGGYSSPTEILAILYMRLKRIPFALSSDGGFSAKDEPMLKRKFKQLLVSSAHFWIASSKGTQQYLEFYGADPGRTYLYPFTSLDEEDILLAPLKNYEKETLKHTLGINGMLVLSVGRFASFKGFDVLLNAWQNINCKNASLAIIGGGTEKAAYLRTVECLKLKNVIILDFIKKRDLLTWYRAADVFVLPTRYDTWGLVINEAMAQGLPIVTTDASLAGLELVRDGLNGYIVPVNDIAAMADRINLILSDEVTRQRMAEQSLNIIRPYTITNMARSYFDIFQTILYG